MSRIFVDTNVLFPFSVMDLVLALSEDGVHTVAWTDALLDEWERVIVNEQRRSPQAAAAITSAIRDFFADSKVELGDYQNLIDEMPGRDPDDHHHSAAAICGGAAVLLTHNRADFPAGPLAQRGLRVTDPDTYLCELADELPDEVETTIVRLAAEKQRPPKSAADLLDDLARAGMDRFAAKLRPRLMPRSDR